MTQATLFFLPRGATNLGKSLFLHRCVSTSSGLTPLAAAFNTKQQQVPKVWSRITAAEKPSGLFGIPQLTSAAGFGELKNECIGNSAAFVDEAIDPNRTRIVARVFDDLSDELCRVADMSEFVRLAHPDPAFASAAEDACITVSGLVEQLNTHLGLYDALNKVVCEGDGYAETDVDKHVARLFLLDFQQCGIHLDDDSRKMVVKLNDRILQVGQQFAAGTHQPRAIKKSVLPENVRDQFHVDGEHIILNGLHVDSASDLVREAAYKIYYWDEPEQEKLLSELLSSRHHLARLCGYDTFASRAMVESLASDPETVGKFLSKLSRDLKTRVTDDYATMFNMKKHVNPLAKSLEVWDVPYFSNIAKSNWFSVDTAKISEYFSLGVCMEGLNTIFKALYSVELQMETPREGEIWHKDVYKIAVRDLAANGETLGYIFCDFFTRPGKPFQDCHFTIR
jgi:intermediate peptidase